MALRLDGEHFGEILDPLDGRGDLQHKQVRALHARSFEDDPTRMLRAVRYALRYGFEIDPSTLAMIDAWTRSILSQLSGERLRHEFDLIFEERDPAAILVRLAGLDLLRPVHPALAAADPRLPVLSGPPGETIDSRNADHIPSRQSLGWICWLSGLQIADIDSIAERLAFPAALTKAAQAASSMLDDFHALTGSNPSRWTFRLDPLPPLAVHAAYLRTQEPSLHEYLVNWRQVRSRTTGEDLKRRGLPPGPEYQRILSRLRAAWLDGEVSTQGEEFELLGRLLTEEQGNNGSTGLS
jgi:tRNA nucleotidyltransferase (CCA-adding enzyme)